MEPNVIYLGLDSHTGIRKELGVRESALEIILPNRLETCESEKLYIGDYKGIV